MKTHRIFFLSSTPSLNLGSQTPDCDKAVSLVVCEVSLLAGLVHIQYGNMADLGSMQFSGHRAKV
jgi:hypothetical protein